VNGIALVDPQGNVTPLGEGDAVGVRNLPGSSQDHFLVPQGTVTAIEYVASQQAVYVGGTFNMAGDSGVSNIAKYDIATKKWTHMAGGVNNLVGKIIYSARYNSLFMIGTFTAAGNIHTVNRIARYRLDTQQWDAMGFGFEGTAQPIDIVEYNGGILVAVKGTQAGYSNEELFFWNGVVWERFNTQGSADSNPCTSGLYSCTPLQIQSKYKTILFITRL
jgi:hypothetical protein